MFLAVEMNSRKGSSHDVASVVNSSFLACNVCLRDVSVARFVRTYS